ncbi:MAG: 16S rRNA (adenine(1518)-N(6)/adenine(1519)-N(6))-dimethyltransferase RsmA [Methanobacteriaceae archaeon]|nr:16S rRNA (adenine(1518)-N(6)/adenine(1519)-N(6))-dimethyltransferase RsmA [Methanobacteriaceae archaeon]
MITNTQKILEENNIILSKRKSQHYLIDNNKIQQIIDYSNIKSSDVILEIGAGIGTMTIPLAKKAKKVIAIESDKKIVEILEEEIKKESLTNIEIINEDALKIDFPPFNKIVSNLPYQISSPITFKILKYDFEEAILMYQEEFANRMNALAKSRNYSRLSAGLYFRCTTKQLFKVSPNSFIPKPKVNSMVISLIPKKHDLPEIYDDIIRALFQHKNKKVKKALIQSCHELNTDKKVLKEKLSKVNNHLFDEKVFMVSPEEILEITLIMENLL